MKKRWIIPIAIGAIFLPSVLIPLALSLVEFIAEVLPQHPLSITLDFSDTMIDSKLEIKKLIPISHRKGLSLGKIYHFLMGIKSYSGFYKVAYMFGESYRIDY